MSRRDDIPCTNGARLLDAEPGQASGLLFYERQLWKSGLSRIAGVDEAGRGPLAGPVVAAAAVFAPGVLIDGVNDSKKLTAGQREDLFERIHEHALGIGVGVVPPDVIDRINILQATMLAMQEAIASINPAPEYHLIDGNYFTQRGIPCSTIVKGDSLSFSIAAASIIAKVTRDRLMDEFHAQYPQYGFNRHKGYGTRAHVNAIREHGRCPIHRVSFRVASLDNVTPITEPELIHE